MREYTDRSEGRLLAKIFDVHAELSSVAEKRPDQLL